MPPSYHHNSRGESSIQAGIFTDILHLNNLMIKNECTSELRETYNAIFTCATYYISNIDLCNSREFIQGKT